MSAAATGPELVNLTFRDWEGARSARLDAVPRNTTVGEAVGEAVRALQLPFESFYKALRKGKELNHGDSLEEVGIGADEELDLVPEVSAG